MTPEQKAAWTLFGKTEFNVGNPDRPYPMPGATALHISFADLVNVYRGLDAQNVVVTLPVRQ